MDHLSCSEDLRIEGVTNRSWGLPPCGRIRVLEDRPRKVTCTGAASVTKEIPGCWRHEDCGMSAKGWAYEKQSWREPVRSCVSCGLHTWRSGTVRALWSLEDYATNPRFWTMSYRLDLHHWKLVLHFCSVLVFPPFLSKRVFNLFLFLQKPQLRDFGYFKGKLNFSNIGTFKVCGILKLSCVFYNNLLWDYWGHIKKEKVMKEVCLYVRLRRMKSLSFNY